MHLSEENNERHTLKNTERVETFYVDLEDRGNIRQVNIEVFYSERLASMHFDFFGTEGA